MVTVKPTAQTVEKAKVMPEKKFRSGQVSASIWKNQITLQDGTKKDTHSVSIVKNYKDKEDAWQETNSYSPNDLADLETVANECKRYLKLKE